MAHQSSKMRASITSFSLDAHHNKPEEHEENEEEYQSLEEALTGEK